MSLCTSLQSSLYVPFSLLPSPPLLSPVLLPLASCMYCLLSHLISDQFWIIFFPLSSLLFLYYINKFIPMYIRNKKVKIIVKENYSEPTMNLEVVLTSHIFSVLPGSCQKMLEWLWQVIFFQVIHAKCCLSQIMDKLEKRFNHCAAEGVPEGQRLKPWEGQQKSV